MMNDKIESMRTDAGSAGDYALVATCDRALAGSQADRARCADLAAAHAVDTFDLADWLHSCAAGDYLATFDVDLVDPLCLCGWSEPSIDRIKRVLRSRGLRLETDDRGLVVRTREAS